MPITLKKYILYPIKLSKIANHLKMTKIPVFGPLRCEVTLMLWFFLPFAALVTLVSSFLPSVAAIVSC